MVHLTGTVTVHPYPLFPKAELCEELGEEFVLDAVAGDFSEQVPTTCEVYLDKINRHA